MALRHKLCGADYGIHPSPNEAPRLLVMIKREKAHQKNVPLTLVPHSADLVGEGGQIAVYLYGRTNTRNERTGFFSVGSRRTARVLKMPSREICRWCPSEYPEEPFLLTIACAIHICWTMPRQSEAQADQNRTLTRDARAGGTRRPSYRNPPSDLALVTAFSRAAGDAKRSTKPFAQEMDVLAAV